MGDLDVGIGMEVLQLRRRSGKMAGRNEMFGEVIINYVDGGLRKVVGTIVRRAFPTAEH